MDTATIRVERQLPTNTSTANPASTAAVAISCTTSSIQARTNWEASLSGVMVTPAGRVLSSCGSLAGIPVTMGFQPDWVIIKNTGGSSDVVVHHPHSLGAATDDTMKFNADTNLGTGYIKALISQGFRLGTKPQVNGGTQCGGPCSYFWVAFKDGGN